MDNFDTSKWLKNQYLEEAGLLTEANMPSPDFFYKMHKILADFLDEKAIKAGDRMSYFSAEWPLSTAFENYMRKQLEGSQLNEAPGSSLNLSKNDMDKLHKDGELEIDGHKISFKTQESIDEAESTDIEINPYNIDKIDDALKDIKVTQSEFDVS